jgi:hypothetical protein
VGKQDLQPLEDAIAEFWECEEILSMIPIKQARIYLFDSYKEDILLAGGFNSK